MLTAADLNEEGIPELLNREPLPPQTHARAKIILSAIGAQGFVPGRGNQQISQEVIRIAGHENIIVVTTPAKLSRTSTL
ncbi:MAG: NAD(+)/NADH kinase [Methanogenium sp.]|nr:NAD(+)/NADH kinase [Methanogenium sp.]